MTYTPTRVSVSYTLQLPRICEYCGFQYEYTNNISEIGSSTALGVSEEKARKSAISQVEDEVKWITSRPDIYGCLCPKCGQFSSAAINSFFSEGFREAILRPFRRRIRCSARWAAVIVVLLGVCQILCMTLDSWVGMVEVLFWLLLAILVIFVISLIRNAVWLRRISPFDDRKAEAIIRLAYSRGNDHPFYEDQGFFASKIAGYGFTTDEGTLIFLGGRWLVDDDHGFRNIIKKSGTGYICPGCGVVVANNAVLCVKCGRFLDSNRKLQRWAENNQTDMSPEDEKEWTSEKFNCPHCDQSLQAPEEMLGTVIDCPNCNKNITIPKAEILIVSSPAIKVSRGG